MDARTSKENYYLDIADAVSERATCLRRRYGAIIVHNDEIISTGYNGAPRGRRNCTDLGYCTREAMQIPSGQRYELCRSVHAEANAIISAARRDTMNATMYLSGRDAKSNELLYVPPLDHQRRNLPRRSPHRRRRIHRHQRPRLDLQRRFPPGCGKGEVKIVKTGQVSTP